MKIEVLASQMHAWKGCFRLTLAGISHIIVFSYRNEGRRENYAIEKALTRLKEQYDKKRGKG